VLKRGRIVAPAYMYPQLAGGEGELSFGIARYSDDEGESWRQSEHIIVIFLDGDDKGMDGWDEWSVVGT